jgi:hypothetical protein
MSVQAADDQKERQENDQDGGGNKASNGADVEDVKQVVKQDPAGEDSERTETQAQVTLIMLVSKWTMLYQSVRQSFARW